MSLSGLKTLAYNSLGLLIQETVTFAATSQTYETVYGYDSFGNVGGISERYNRLAGVIGDGVNENYVYDDGGIRVRKTSEGVATFYPFAHYEVSGGTVTKHYRFGGQPVAMRRGGTLTQSQECRSLSRPRHGTQPFAGQ